MRDRLAETCVAAAEAGLQWEIRTGDSSRMPAGHNGPYFQLETPLRNTSHWLITFSVAHALSGDSRFREAGHRITRFLLEPGRYRADHALVHRQVGSDGCNGVLGPAWVMEALARSGVHLGQEEAARAAADELAQLPFDARTEAWHRVDPVDGPGAVDYTYNHQAWLAAAAADVPDGSGRGMAERFLDRSHAGGLQVGEDGIVHHILHATTLRGRALLARFATLRRVRAAAVRGKERGYHLYVLLPLIRLRAVFPEHPLFGSERFRRAVAVAESDGFVAALDGNRYAFPYNAPGFEVPILACLPGDRGDLILETMDEQERRTLDPETGLHTRNAADPATLAARIYELALAAESLHGLAPAAADGGHG